MSFVNKIVLVTFGCLCIEESLYYSFPIDRRDATCFIYNQVKPETSVYTYMYTVQNAFLMNDNDFTIKR